MITLGWCLSTYFEATFHSELIIDERWAQLLMEELVLCPEIKDINGLYKNNKSAITTSVCLVAINIFSNILP